MDIGQVGYGVVAEANGTSVIDRPALAGQGQFDSLSDAGWKVRDIRDVITAQQSD
ncbi:hypothetical protein D3C85_1709940 [compost metagenome]